MYVIDKKSSCTDCQKFTKKEKNMAPKYRWGDKLQVDSKGKYSDGFFDGIEGTALEVDVREGVFYYKISSIDTRVFPESFLTKLGMKGIKE